MWFRVKYAESYAEVPNLCWEPADLSRGLLVLGKEWSDGFDSRCGKMLPWNISCGCLPCGHFRHLFHFQWWRGKEKVSTVVGGGSSSPSLALKRTNLWNYQVIEIWFLRGSAYKTTSQLLKQGSLDGKRVACYLTHKVSRVDENKLYFHQ